MRCLLCASIAALAMGCGATGGDSEPYVISADDAVEVKHDPVTGPSVVQHLEGELGSEGQEPIVIATEAVSTDESADEHEEAVLNGRPTELEDHDTMGGE